MAEPDQVAARLQRIVLGAVVAAAAVLFTRATIDVFNTVKATAVALGAITCLAVAAHRAIAARRVSVPASPLTIAAGVFAVLMIPAVLAAERPMLAIVGDVGRHTGFAMYLLYAVLALVAVRAFAGTRGDEVTAALLLAAVPVVGYGLLQTVGLDPIPWTVVEGGPQVFSTFGNANFFAAWCGIVVVLGTGAVLRRDWPLWARRGAGALAVLALIVAIVSMSLQGPLAALVGLAVVAGGALWSIPSERLHRVRVPLVAGAGVLAVLGAGAIAAGPGPFATVRSMAARSLETRVGKWEAALAMLGDRPLRGVGLDRYGDAFHAYRSAELAAESGLRRTTDTPHNVVLDMLAGGGWPLGLAYLAVIAVTLWALVTGLRRLDGLDRLALATLGGAWAAYQTQAMVSIDVPPLAALHWVLAGAIVGMAARPGSWTLPAATSEPKAAPTKGKRKARGPRRRPAPAWAAPVVVVVALLVAIPLLAPLRAELAAANAGQAAQAGDAAGAISELERASEIAWWEANYLSLLGGLLNQAGQPEAAVTTYALALERRPRDLGVVIDLSRTAASAEQTDVADAAYARMMELDPHTPDVWVMVGRWELSQGREDRAVALLEDAVEARSDNADWWVLLGQARSVAGDTEGARVAFERALDLDADAVGAREGLDRLS